MIVKGCLPSGKLPVTVSSDNEDTLGCEQRFPKETADPSVLGRHMGTAKKHGMTR